MGGGGPVAATLFANAANPQEQPGTNLTPETPLSGSSQPRPRPKANPDSGKQSKAREFRLDQDRNGGVKVDESPPTQSHD